MGAEHLALAGAEIHLLRVAVIHGNAESRACWYDSLVKSAPGLASIGGAQHTALLAAEVQADAGVQGAGVVGSDLDAAGVADVGEVFELEIEHIILCRYRLRPRMLRDVSNIDMKTTIIGDVIDFPIGVAPTAMQRMAHDEGELATARG